MIVCPLPAPGRGDVDTARLPDGVGPKAHRLLVRIRQFDEAGRWADQGALSCARWLRWRIGLERGAAREHVRVARAITDLPLSQGKGERPRGARSVRTFEAR